MKTNNYHIILILLLLVSLLVSCNQDTKETKLETLISVMHNLSLNIAEDEPLIETTHFAYNSDNKTFLLGLTFNGQGVPSIDQQKKIFETYLTKATVSATDIDNWRIALKDYSVSFEHLLHDNKSNVLATKEINSESIEYNSSE
ncbi:hypothetical protein ACFQ3J_23550 [Paenibacillus provencensis]|uniref:Uncharacterized protein n=1 Tax=Paenibacillus provencensis TaxID=441151 RepID=A0ABW3Q8Z0_9BACL|nr:hypothetical protein [Paenibacillus sp. MER 78]MCM3131074.1 hypothetical protein [Paenibacillus sp. MER 78]